MDSLFDHPQVMAESVLLLHSLEFVGVFAHAVVGAAVARRYGLDPLGFAVLAVLTALGGGMIRDTLIQHGPPVVLVHWAYITIALAGAAVAYLAIVEEGRLWVRLYPYVDGLAMGCFASVGAHKAFLLGFGWLPAVLLGALTAVGGGVLRDVAVGRMPLIFSGNLYATCALISSTTMVVMDLSGYSRTGLVVGSVVGALLWPVARRRQWRLPSSPGWLGAPSVTPTDLPPILGNR